jgi:hypothetical protein
MPFATSVTVHVIAQKIRDTTHVKPQRVKRIEVGRYTFKNKYKFFDTKNYLDATSTGSVCWIQHKYKIYIAISIRVLF